MISPKRLVFETAAKAILPPPAMNIWQCADKYRVLPKSAGYAEPGRYRTSRTPYLREPMETLSPSSPIQQIKVMKGTQQGWTEIVNNWIVFDMLFNQGPMMMVLPTVELATKHSKKKLSKTIQATPSLKGVIKPSRTKDSGNTILLKEYEGGSIALAGSNSGASFRSDSIRDLALDDLDGYPFDVDGEGDPCDLAINRTDAYANRKILKISTPTTKGTSRIEAEYNDSDQRKYFVPCPHCNQKQELEWGGKRANFGIKFELSGEDKKQRRLVRVWYECKFCHQAIEEHHKTWMLENGEWIPQNPGHPDAGFHLSSLYSPVGWRSWRDIVSEFLKIKNNIQREKRWVNTRLGLPFEEEGSQPDWTILKARCEPYKILEVPIGGGFLTAGVDVQDNRIAVKIKAWGRGEESWLIYWGEIYGDPAQDPNPGPAQGQIWKELDQLLYRSYRHAGGAELTIIYAAVDSGGHHTQEVYNYCRTRTTKAFPVKGASISNKPILGRPSKQDVNYRGAKIKSGIDLWPVGTDTAKSQIYGRLRMATSGPGCMHFYIGLPDEYFTQLTAEKLVTRYTASGYPKSEWVNVAEDKRNEALDCEVYALAAAHRAGLPRINWDDHMATVIGAGKAEEAKPKKATIAKSKWMDQ